MSTIGSLATRVHNMTPKDELIGSLTRERVTLLVQEAGNLTRADLLAAKCWLSYALNADIPANAFDQLAAAFEQAEMVKDCDLMYWYDVPNSWINRAKLQRGADMTIDHCVILLTNRLCTQLGIQS